MKHCVLTGGGSKFGADLTESFLELGYTVHLITSSGSKWQGVPNVNIIPVNWHELDISKLKTLIPPVEYIDVVLFNHNTSALSIDKFKSNSVQSLKDWQHSYFVATQFPYYYVKALSKKIDADSKIGWMLSELIKHQIVSQVGFSDYIGNKVANACIMKSFSINGPSCFFGVHPDGGTESDPKTKATNMVKLIDTYDRNKLNGNIFNSQGIVLL